MRLEPQAGPSGGHAENMAVVCSATPPYAVVWASESWLRLCGFDSLNDILGRSLSCIQGPSTDSAALNKIIQAVKASRPCGMRLINYHRVGLVPFIHTVSVTPLHSTEGAVTLFRATSTEVTWLCEQPASTPPSASASFTTHTCASIAPHDASNGSHSREKSKASAADMSSSSASDEASNGSHYFASPKRELRIWDTFPVTVVTEAQPPYAVLWASRAWLQLCGVTSAELTGQPLHAIQGPATDSVVVNQLMSAVREKRSCNGVQLVNYHKSGAPFRHTLSIERLKTPCGLRYLRATSTNVSRLGAKYLPGDSMDDSSCHEVEPSIWGEDFETHQACWDECMNKLVSI